MKHTRISWDGSEGVGDVLLLPPPLSTACFWTDIYKDDVNGVSSTFSDICFLQGDQLSVLYVQYVHIYMVQAEKNIKTR